jgi:hypothetical protein
LILLIPVLFFILANAGCPLTTSDKALFTIDVWEHAYYIDYRNGRPLFVQTVLNNLANWEFASKNFETKWFFLNSKLFKFKNYNKKIFIFEKYFLKNINKEFKCCGWCVIAIPSSIFTTK